MVKEAAPPGMHSFIPRKWYELPLQVFVPSAAEQVLAASVP